MGTIFWTYYPVPLIQRELLNGPVFGHFMERKNLFIFKSTFMGYSVLKLKKILLEGIRP